jgi:hypothetical protein
MIAGGVEQTVTGIFVYVRLWMFRRRGGARGLGL